MGAIAMPTSYIVSPKIIFAYQGGKIIEKIGDFSLNLLL
jgi:hypothetical protein